MSPPEDPPTLSEIARTLADFRAEMRGALATVVRTDVYRAEQSAAAERVAALERELARLERERERDEGERAAMRRATYTAVLSGVGGLLIALSSALFGG